MLTKQLHVSAQTLVEDLSLACALLIKICRRHLLVMQLKKPINLSRYHTRERQRGQSLPYKEGNLFCFYAACGSPSHDLTLEEELIDIISKRRMCMFLSIINGEQTRGLNLIS